MDVILLALGKVGMSLLMSLLTEGAIKRLAIHSLEAVARKTANQTDDKMVADVKAAWGLSPDA